MLESLEKSQREIQSLVVEFTLRRRDKIFATTQDTDGIFRLIRAPAGEIHASYELNPESSQGANPARFVALLNNQTISIPDEKQKLELGWKFADKDLLPFLEDYFNPWWRALDWKARTEERLPTGNQTGRELHLFVAEASNR